MYYPRFLKKCWYLFSKYLVQVAVHVLLSAGLGSDFTKLTSAFLSRQFRRLIAFCFLVSFKLKAVVPYRNKVKQRFPWTKWDSSRYWSYRDTVLVRLSWKTKQNSYYENASENGLQPRKWCYLWITRIFIVRGYFLLLTVVTVNNLSDCRWSSIHASHLYSF